VIQIAGMRLLGGMCEERRRELIALADVHRDDAVSELRFPP